LASVIYCEIKKDPNCAFVKVAPMTFGLKEWISNGTLVLEDHIDETQPKAKKRKKKKEETIKD
jgi:hypothetical protein